MTCYLLLLGLALVHFRLNQCWASDTRAVTPLAVPLLALVPLVPVPPGAIAQHWFEQGHSADANQFTGKSYLADAVLDIMRCVPLPLPNGEKMEFMAIKRSFGDGLMLEDATARGNFGGIEGAAVLLRSALMPHVDETDIRLHLASIPITNPKHALETIAAAYRLFNRLAPRAPLAVALVFDEVQEVHRAGGSGTTKEAADEAMQDFTEAFARLPCMFPRPADGGDLFVVTFLSGTTPVPHLRPSMLAVKELPLPLLTQSQARQLTEVALNEGKPLPWAEYVQWLCVNVCVPVCVDYVSAYRCFLSDFPTGMVPSTGSSG